jgi:hypothetical protein
MRDEVVHLGLTSSPQGWGCYHERQLGNTTAPMLVLYGVNDWVAEAAKKLEAISGLQAGWDSYGGRPLTPAAKRSTVEVIRTLEGEDLPVPAVALCSGGTVQLEWRHNGRELDIDVGKGDEYEYVTCDQAGQVKEGRADRYSPSELSKLARWLLNR